MLPMEAAGDLSNETPPALPVRVASGAPGSRRLETGGASECAAPTPPAALATYWSFRRSLDLTQFNKRVLKFTEFNPSTYSDITSKSEFFFAKLAVLAGVILSGVNGFQVLPVVGTPTTTPGEPKT